MNEIESTATSVEKSEVPVVEPPDLDVRLAHELIEKARRTGVSLVGPDGLLAGVTRTVLQTALDTEMTEHLGYEKGNRAATRPGNHRNGSSPKTVRTEVGPVTLAVPRDRNGEFEPVGAHSWSPRPPSCAGTANSSPAAGPLSPSGPVDRLSPLACAP